MTRILAISDLHLGTVINSPLGIRVDTQERVITELIAREPDIIMIAGDVQDHMWNDGKTSASIPIVKKAIKEDPIINSLNSAQIPVYFVWGNTDIMDCEKETIETPITDDLRIWFTDEFTNFHHCHKQVHKVDNFTVVGYQDANKTDPYSSGKSWEEPTIHHDLRPIIERLTKEQKDQLILLTHAPPRGILDFSSLGSRHIGSFYLRELIDDFQPKLAMFGHVHYLGGYSLYCGRTQCINISSFGLAVSHEILFGQSAFEVVLDPESEEISTTMIVPHFWEGKKKQNFVEYRTCQGCGRHAPFARRQFKYCRICLSTRRLQSQVAQSRD